MFIMRIFKKILTNRRYVVVFVYFFLLSQLCFAPEFLNYKFSHIPTQSDSNFRRNVIATTNFVANEQKTK